MRTRTGLLVLLLALPSAPLFAQEAEASPAGGQEEAAAQAEEEATAEGEEEAPAVKFVKGPADGDLGGIAALKVPEGYLFVPKEEMPKFNELTGNLPDSDDVGALLSRDGWVVFFSFSEIGYVKDDDHDDLDTDGLLDGLKKGQAQSNEERRKAGMDTFEVKDWSTPPFYDPQTNNLTWAVRYVDEKGHESINHQVRLLGRRGVMSVILAAEPDQMPKAVPALTSLLGDYAYAPGQRYSEWRKGDRLAEYGLAGLVAGGGLLMAAKTGLLATLGKYIKVVFVAVAGAGAALWKKIKAFFGR